MGFQPRVALACEAVRRTGLPDGFDPLKVRSSFDAVQDLVLWGLTCGGESQWGAAANEGAQTQLPGADAAMSRLSRIPVSRGKERRSASRSATRASSGSSNTRRDNGLTTPCLLGAGSVLSPRCLRVYLPAAWGN